MAVADGREPRCCPRGEAALTKYDQDHLAADFDTVVDTLTASATQQGYAPVLEAMTFHPRRPKVVFGPTLTTGFFERITNTITLDPIGEGRAQGRPPGSQRAR